MSGPSSNPSPICGHHHHHQHVKPDAIALHPFQKTMVISIYQIEFAYLRVSVAHTHICIIRKKKILRYLHQNRAIPLFIVLHNFTSENAYLIEDSRHFNFGHDMFGGN